MLKVNDREYEKYNEGLDLNADFGNYIKKKGFRYSHENYIPEVIITDYIAGMTDQYALKWIKAITMPEPIKF